MLEGTWLHLPLACTLRAVQFGRTFHGGNILQFGTITHLGLLSTLPMAGETEQQNAHFIYENSYQWLLRCGFVCHKQHSFRVSYDCVVGKGKDIDGVMKRIKDRLGSGAESPWSWETRWAGKGAAPSPIMQCTFVGNGAKPFVDNLYVAEQLPHCHLLKVGPQDKD